MTAFFYLGMPLFAVAFVMHLVVVIRGLRSHYVI